MWHSVLVGGAQPQSVVDRDFAHACKLSSSLVLLKFLSLDIFKSESCVFMLL